MFKNKSFGWGIYPWVLLISLVILTPSGLSKTTSPLIPPSEIQDQIVHNKGNITTTIQNWGQIGGQSHLGKPSGEWPKGSGYNYLAEIKYWMGAIKTSGDTMVANTEDDFMPISMPISGEDGYKIRLSTDPSTYDYNSEDTVGLGIGKPAYGWKVWDVPPPACRC